MSQSSAMPPLPAFEVVQEDDAVASRKVTAITVASIVITIAAVAVTGAILAASARPPRAKGAVAVAPRQIAGIHQTMIERDRHGWDLAERQRQSLEVYRWVDRQRGIAQIPIEQAMQIVADDDARQRGAR